MFNFSSIVTLNGFTVHLVIFQCIANFRNSFGTKMKLRKYWKYYGEKYCPNCKILLHRDDFDVISYDTTDHEGNPSKSKMKVCKNCKGNYEYFRPFIFRSTSLLAYFFLIIGIFAVSLANDLNSNMEFGEIWATCGFIFLGLLWASYDDKKLVSFKNDKLIIDEIASKT